MSLSSIIESFSVLGVDEEFHSKIEREIVDNFLEGCFFTWDRIKQNIFLNNFISEINIINYLDYRLKNLHRSKNIIEIKKNKELDSTIYFLDKLFHFIINKHLYYSFSDELIGYIWDYYNENNFNLLDFIKIIPAPIKSPIFEFLKFESNLYDYILKIISNSPEKQDENIFKNILKSKSSTSTADYKYLYQQYLDTLFDNVKINYIYRQISNIQDIYNFPDEHEYNKFQLFNLQIKLIKFLSSLCNYLFNINKTLPGNNDYIYYLKKFNNINIFDISLFLFLLYLNIKIKPNEASDEYKLFFQNLTFVKLFFNFLPLSTILKNKILEGNEVLIDKSNSNINDFSHQINFQNMDFSIYIFLAEFEHIIYLSLFIIQNIINNDILFSEYQLCYYTFLLEIYHNYSFAYKCDINEIQSYINSFTNKKLEFIIPQINSSNIWHKIDNIKSCVYDLIKIDLQQFNYEKYKSDIKKYSFKIISETHYIKLLEYIPALQNINVSELSVKKIKLSVSTSKLSLKKISYNQSNKIEFFLISYYIYVLTQFVTNEFFILSNDKGINYYKTNALPHFYKYFKNIFSKNQFNTSDISFTKFKNFLLQSYLEIDNFSNANEFKILLSQYKYNLFNPSIYDE